MSRERTLRRGRRRRSLLLCTGLALFLAASLSLVGPGIDGLERARRRGLESFGSVDSFSFANLRFDPFFARGLVLDDVRLSLGKLAVRVPALFVRPNLGATLRGRIEPAFVATRFDVQVSAGSVPEAFVAIYRALEHASWPGDSLILRGGRVVTREGAPLLHHVELRIRRSAAGLRVTLRARQKGGGRIDVLGDPGHAFSESRLDIYLDAVQTGDLRGWIAAQVGARPARLAAVPVDGRATGRWVVRSRGGDRMVHHLDVRLEGLPRPEGPESSAFDRDRSRLEARLTGSLGVHPADVQRVVAAPTGRAAPSPPQRLEGWIRVEGRAGRLPTFAFSKGGSPRLLVSGPFQAWAAIGGTPRAPVISLSVSLDRTRLEIGRWLRKPAGVLARLQIEPEARDAPFPARVVIELGDVAARGKLGAGGRLRLATEWVPVTTLRRWVPEIEARAHRGAVRLALETAEPGSTWRVDLNGVEIDPAPIAIPHVELSGQGRLVGGTLLEVRGLQAKLGTSRFVLDLRAQRHAGSGGMRLRFHARTDRMDLSGLEPEEEEPLALEPGEDALALPSALRAAVERPLVLLQRTRARLANVELQSGRLEARRVNCGSETLQDLVVDLALENRRLEVHRFSFRDAEGLRDYGGQIDLNPLVPRVDLVARSTSTLPAAMPLP